VSNKAGWGEGGDCDSYRTPAKVWKWNSNAEAIFHSFFMKKRAFLVIFWFNFLFKNTFLKDCKVC